MSIGFDFPAFSFFLVPGGEQGRKNTRKEQHGSEDRNSLWVRFQNKREVVTLPPSWEE